MAPTMIFMAFRYDEKRKIILHATIQFNSIIHIHTQSCHIHLSIGKQREMKHIY